MSFLTEPGVWVERRSARRFPTGRALFLDRDGVINVDHGYVGDPKDVTLIAPTARLIARANAAGIATVVVTNQSGIGRGYYDWDGFAATMDRIHETLVPYGATLDMVCACAYHRDALPPYQDASHPTRKPNPGMITLACAALDLDPAASLIIGDSWSDMQAGAAAGVPTGAYLGRTPPPSPLPTCHVTAYSLPQDGDQLLADYETHLQATA